MTSRERQAEINRGVVDALCRFMPENVAREVVRAIAKGEIQKVFINYKET